MSASNAGDLFVNVDCDINVYDYAFNKTGGSGPARDVVENNATIFFDRCVIDNSGAGGIDDSSGVRDSSTSSILNNCVVLNSSGSTLGTGLRDGCDCYNCVILNQQRATRSHGIVKNTIFQDNGTDLYSFSGTSANNLTDNSSLSVSNNVTSSTLTFADKTNKDYHLASGDTDAMDAGVGPSTDANVPSADIDGDTRSGTTCDIGLDEYVVAAGSFIPVYIQTKSKHYVRR